MKDEFNNEAPYDFKNILFGGTKADGIDHGYTYLFDLFISNTHYDASVPDSTPYSSETKCCCNNIIKTEFYPNRYMYLRVNGFYATDKSKYY
jgi:hypothetical protein